MGDPSTGKTGSLAALVKAGYKLRVLDYDNGLDSLIFQVKKLCPDKLGNIHYETLTDKVKSSPAGPMLDGQPTAFIQGTKLLDRWKIEEKGKPGEPGYVEGYDLGVPATWGPECILVIDSLTFFSDAAMNYAEVFKFSKDRRQIYGAAQDAIEFVLALLKSKEFNTNVILIAHVRYVDRDDGLRKGYPKTAGTANAPTIPAYFNTALLMETSGSGANVQRTIRTAPTGLMDLKNPAAFSEPLPIADGLATLFSKLRG